MRRLNSLAFQLLAITLGTVTLLSIISSLYLYDNVRVSLNMVMERRASQLADQLGFAVEPLLKHDDAIAVQRIVEKISTFEDVQDIVMVNRDGTVIAAKNFTTLTSKTNPSLTEYGLEWADVLSVIQSERSRAARAPNAYAVVAPLHGRVFDPKTQSDIIGAIIVKMSLSDVERQLYDELRQRGWFNLAMLAIVAAAVVPFVYLAIIHPLRRLTLATQTLAAGDLTTRVPQRGAREIAQLTESFNQMANDLEKHLREQTTLNEISSTISTTLDLDTLLRFTANFCARLVDGTGAFITLWDAENNRTKPVAAYGSFDMPYKQIDIPADEPTLTAHVVRTGEPQAVRDVFNSPFISPRIATQFPDRSLLGVPLIAQGKPIGALLIGEMRRQREFTPHEIRLAQSAAGQIASAISHALLFAELSAERQRLNDILTTLSDAIVLTDPHGIPQYGNPAFEKMIGLPLEQVLHRPIPPTWLDGLNLTDALNQACAIQTQGNLWRRELAGRRADGTTFDADVVVSPLYRQGQIVGYLASIRDITEMKELDRMKDRFVASVSHELRSPVSVILLHLDNLLTFYERIPAGTQRQILSEARQETDTLQHLIENLLVLSRLDSGRAEMRLSAWDLRGLLDELVARARVEANPAGITLNLHLPDQPLPVYADREQLAQVFRNLLSNAIKFNQPHGWVAISARPNTEHIHVEISDSGIGIPAEDLPKLFQRFYRSRISVENEIQGTGLGLAIAREILQRHHGAVDVRSQVGSGTTFQITLPYDSSALPRN